MSYMGMEKAMDKHKLVEEAHIMLHPERFRIVELLSEKPMYINAIAKALKMERRLVSYHLSALEAARFVESKYEISTEIKSRGKALRMYWLTDKVKAVIEQVKKEL